jgi:hypothetical protein
VSVSNKLQINSTGLEELNKYNGLTDYNNGLINNGLTDYNNGLTNNGLTNYNNGLTNNGLTNNGLTNNELTNNELTNDMKSELNDFFNKLKL